MSSHNVRKYKDGQIPSAMARAERRKRLALAGSPVYSSAKVPALREHTPDAPTMPRRAFVLAWVTEMPTLAAYMLRPQQQVSPAL